jgi:hypothetical protein
MEKIQAYDNGVAGRIQLMGDGPGDPQWREYVGTIDGSHATQRAKEIEQAANAYPEHIALLEALQTTFAAIDGRVPSHLYDAFNRLSKRIDEQILQHHEFIESQP